MTLSLVTETAVDTDQPEIIFTADQFDKIDPQFRRRLAAEFQGNDINGKSTALEIKSALAVQRTLDDYSD